VTTAKEALSALGLDMDEVLEVDKSLRNRTSDRDGRVCLCGHGVTRHTEIPGGHYCLPSRMSCPCLKLRPVIDTEDTRPFMRKTQGMGSLHALSRGLAAVAMKGKDAHWIIELVCDKCGEFNDSIIPVPVSKQGVPMEEATGLDRLLCPNCRGQGVDE